MKRRDARAAIEKALNRQAAVAIIGPRQVGKTTLALSFEEDHNAIYLDLEDPEDRRKLSSPALFFEQVEDHLIILDEIHRLPALFPALRGIIDRGKRKGRKTGRFLVLGSASLDLLKQSGESLAGRIAYTELLPFSISEVAPTPDQILSLWLRGGFPESFLALDDDQSHEIRMDFIQSYLDRDIPMFGPRVPAETMRRLWTMLSHNQGNPLNASVLASALPTSPQSVTRYLDLLVDLLLIRRLTPWAKNTSKRMVKSPKTYVRDSGLIHTLLGIRDLAQLLGHPVVGASWEGFVIENIIGSSPQGCRFSYYRSSGGAEIDLIIEFPNDEVWAIEIKRARVPKVSRGFHSAIEDVAPSQAFVVHGGADQFPVNEKITAIGVRDFLKLLPKS